MDCTPENQRDSPTRPEYTRTGAAIMAAIPVVKASVVPKENVVSIQATTSRHTAVMVKPWKALSESMISAR